MQNISIVIPLGKGSWWGNNELKYCLRAVEKHLKNYGEIFIIGELPPWLTNVYHINAKDGDDVIFKERNIYNKINVAIGCHMVTDNFLFMNDDHILLSDFDAPMFPTYIKEDLMTYVDRNRENHEYRTTLVNTITFLRPQGYAEDNYDTHCPIIYNKEKFKKLSKVNWDAHFGYGIKSLYGNINNIPSVFHHDIKCGSIGQEKDWLQKRIKGALFMSLTHFVNADMRQILEEMLPDKSKYEL